MLAYLRTSDDGRWLVALNLGAGAGRLDLAVRGQVELATTPERDGGRVEGGLDLAGDEGLVVRLDEPIPGSRKRRRQLMTSDRPSAAVAGRHGTDLGCALSLE